jgi:hypothetical protein
MSNLKIDFNFIKLKNTISKSEEIYEKKIQEYEKQVEDLFRKKLFKEALELSVHILQQLDQERVEDDIIVNKNYKKILFFLFN